MGFGKILDEKIKSRNLKQSDLAAAVGIPKSTLSSMISRDNMKIDIDVFLKMCQFLQCDPEEFYQDYAQNKKSPSPEDDERETYRKILTDLSDDELIELKEFTSYLRWKREHKE